MAQIKIPLLKEYKRPIIELYDNWAMIDTGAVIPVLSMHPKKVQQEFSGKMIKEGLPIGGIGGESTGDVYRLPEFRVGGLIYSPFEVFVPRQPLMKFPILLSATMFYGMDYTVKNSTGEFVIDTGDVSDTHKIEFRLLTLKGGLYPQIDGVLIQDGGILLADLAIPSVFTFG